MPDLPPSKLSPWRLQEQETVAHHRVFDVLRTRYDRTETPFYTLRCPDWCNVLAVTPDNHVVLVRQFRFGPSAVSLEIPGGMINAGEDPARTAQRELEEESGYRAERFELLSNLCPNPALQGNRLYSFVAWNAVPVREAETHGVASEFEECETVLWPRARLLELLEQGAVDHALCAIVLETFLRRFGAS